MKIVVLVDNNTYINEYYYGEPAVSYYIEDGELRMLFDVGYSDIFMQNANKMHIDLDSVNKVIISHGHDDHTGGLKHFLSQKRPIELIAHPDSFNYKIDEDQNPIGAPLSEAEIAQKSKLTLSKSPIWLNDKIVFLGEIPLSNDFELRYTIGKVYFDASDLNDLDDSDDEDIDAESASRYSYNYKLRKTRIYDKRDMYTYAPAEPRFVNGKMIDDEVKEDSAIAYRGEDGLFIVTGCSHSGICNIIEYAKQVCNDDRVYGVLGGFHLLKNDHRLHRTIEYLERNQIPLLYPCHCVSLESKVEMAKRMGIREVGVGMTLEIL